MSVSAMKTQYPLSLVFIYGLYIHQAAKDSKFSFVKFSITAFSFEYRYLTPICLSLGIIDTHTVENLYDCIYCRSIESFILQHP